MWLPAEVYLACNCGDADYAGIAQQWPRRQDPGKKFWPKDAQALAVGGRALAQGQFPELYSGENRNLNSLRKDRFQNENEDPGDDIHGNNWGLKLKGDWGSYPPPFSVFIEKSDR